MFDTLSEKLQHALGDLRGKGRLDEEAISKAMREIRLALLEAAFRQGDAPSPNRPRASEGRLVPGSRLIRVWKAERHEVEVTETGYLWRGRSWASLSAIARAITGVRRNGPAFFGLRDGGAR